MTHTAKNEACEATPSHLREEGWFEHYARTADGQIYRDMTETAPPIARNFLRVCDLTGVRSVVDVGGGYGAFLATVLQERPALKGIVFDLPAVQGDAQRYLASGGIADRCTFVGGSFFETLPQGADVYCLLRVIRNWGDHEAVDILKRCRHSMQSQGRILIIDPIPAVRQQPSALELQARRVLRTEAELRSLLDAAGLRVKQVKPISDWGCLVEAVPLHRTTEKER